MSKEKEVTILRNINEFSFSDKDELLNNFYEEKNGLIQNLKNDDDGLIERNSGISKFTGINNKYLTTDSKSTYEKQIEIQKLIENINQIIDIRKEEEKKGIENIPETFQNIVDLNDDREFNNIQKAFEKKQHELKVFSNSIPKTVVFKKLDGGNHWYGPSVKATKDDVNFITKDIQYVISNQNKEIISVYKQFDTIYGLFSTLNREYLQRILTNLSAINNVDKNTRKKIEEIHKLGSVVQNHKKILKSHKQQLVELQNRKNIDEFYNEFIFFQEEQDKVFEKIQDSLLQQNLLNADLQQKHIELVEKLENLKIEKQLFIDDVQKKIKLLNVGIFFYSVTLVMLIILITIIVNGVM